MDFRLTIDTNKRIMELIRSKYPNDFPTGYSGLEYTYYKRLERDVDDAERQLSHAGKK